MLLPLLSLTVLTPPSAPPSLGSIEGLAPSAVGEVILRARDHGIIESVNPDRGLDPPGVVKLILTERPSRISGGCLRRKWRATFQHKPGAAENTSVLSDAYSTNEVSLVTVPDCSNGEFAHVSPGLSIEEALTALRHLRRMRSGKANVRFACSDSTGSKLCRTPKMIRQELTRLPAWAVTKKNGNMELWLGKGGQAVTAVNYSETSPHHVSVERRIPAPF